MTVVSVVLSSDACRHSEGTQRDPSARTAGDFGQSLASPHALHPPALYIQVLIVRRRLNTRPPGVPGVCEVLRSDAYRHSDGTQWDLSARNVGDLGQLLVFPHVLHPPVLYIPELEMR